MENNFDYGTEREKRLCGEREMIARWPKLMSQVAGVKLSTHDATATFSSD